MQGFCDWLYILFPIRWIHTYWLLFWSAFKLTKINLRLDEYKANILHATSTAYITSSHCFAPVYNQRAFTRVTHAFVATVYYTVIVPSLRHLCPDFPAGNGSVCDTIACFILYMSAIENIEWMLIAGPSPGNWPCDLCIVWDANRSILGWKKNGLWGCEIL